MASVKKRTWRGTNGEKREGWRVSYTDRDGKRRFKQFRTARDANAYRVKVESELAAGIHTPDAASITVADACDLLIAKATAKRRERGTIKGYKEIADLHIKPLIGTEKLSRLSTPDVEDFAMALLNKCEPVMARKVVRTLSRALTEAQRRGKVAQNVARDVKVEVSERDREHIQIPAKEELRAMLDAAKRLGNAHPELYPLTLTAALAALRSSELRGLAWPQVDLRSASPGITVSQRADAWCVIGPPKSKAGRRTIPIGPFLVSALREWKLRCPPSPADLVFPNSAGRPMWQSALYEDLWRTLMAEAGLMQPRDGRSQPRYGLHDLRHYAASAWIDQGIDLKRLQTWMGHSTITLTLNTYGHLMRDAGKDAALAGGAEASLLA